MKGGLSRWVRKINLSKERPKGNRNKSREDRDQESSLGGRSHFFRKSTRRKEDDHDKIGSPWVGIEKG